MQSIRMITTPLSIGKDNNFHQDNDYTILGTLPYEHLHPSTAGATMATWSRATGARRSVRSRTTSPAPPVFDHLGPPVSDLLGPPVLEDLGRPLLNHLVCRDIAMLTPWVHGTNPSTLKRKGVKGGFGRRLLAGVHG